MHLEVNKFFSRHAKATYLKSFRPIKVAFLQIKLEVQSLSLIALSMCKSLINQSYIKLKTGFLVNSGSFFQSQSNEIQ